jgi:uncharacterized protein YecE (DUF72 family)
MVVVSKTLGEQSRDDPKLQRILGESAAHKGAQRCPAQRSAKRPLESYDMKTMKCEIRIGTSGYHYRHWQGPFYPAGSSAPAMWNFYLRHFDTVELNNSFYRLPSESALDDWRNSTPSDFRFAMKASRFLTHNKKLKDPESALRKFLPRIMRLGAKLGPVLFQLPPRWKVNLERLQGLLEALPPSLRSVFEFRDPTWIQPEVHRLLEKFGSAFCVYELSGYRSPLSVTADFAYVRLHGPGSAKYEGSYSPYRLRQWNHQIALWAEKLKAVYVYFDNDQAGFAARNALTLKRMVRNSMED